MKSNLTGIDALPSSAAQRLPCFPATRRCSISAFQKSSTPWLHSKGSLFWTGKWLLLTRKGDLPFSSPEHPSHEVPVFFYAFDLLNQDGELLLSSPIERRRKLLAKLLSDPDDPLRLSPQLQARRDTFLRAVRKLDLEGVVGKRIDSTYEPGERS